MGNGEGTEDLFVFNGIDGVTGDYLWDPMTAAQVSALAQGKEPDDEQQEARLRHEHNPSGPFDIREGLDATSLTDSGWGIIFAQDADPAVREALEPLIEHRRQQAGERFVEYFETYAYRGERKSKFLKARKAPTTGPVDPERMPYYLLLVGSPEEIPFEFQAQLGLQYAVGRLHFSTVDEYDSYARSVVASESGQLRVSRSLGLWGPQNPNDRATKLSSEGLIDGIHRYVEGGGAKGGLSPWSVEVQRDEKATKATLTDMLGGAQTPAVLMTASHGVGFPCGHERQRAHQGGLICQDWGGPRSGPMNPDLYFAGDDLSDEANVFGLIAFLFACYGGGMPKDDAFSHGRNKRKQLAPHPFFAALPQRMLGHPRGGALAAVGHVERAWGSSFYESRSGHQIAMFESFMERLLTGQPIGHAMSFFGQRYGEVSAELLQKIEDIGYGEKISDIELANDWTVTNDARNYLILGDPAVRVPVVDDDEAVERPTLPTLEIRSDAPKSAENSAAPAGSSSDASAVLEHDTPPETLEGYGLFGRKDDDDDKPATTSDGQPSTTDSLKSFVSKLGTKISEALEDMSSLEVRTYVADELSQVTVKDGQLQGARLRAYTRISLDGDTSVCLPERDGEIDQAAFEIHQKAVTQAQKARAELMQTIVNAATSLVKLV